VSFSVPAGFTRGTTFARFRLSTARGLAATGMAPDGEVEDYELTLTAAGDPAAVQATLDGGTMAVVRTANGDFQVRQGDTLLFQAPISNRLTIRGTTGDDSLDVQFAGGNPCGPGGIVFQAGGQASPTPGDAVQMSGGTFSQVTYTYTGPHDGTVQLGSDCTIAFSDIEPLLNTGTAIDVVFNLSGAADDAVLEDDGVAGDGFSRLRSLNGSYSPRS
jgi:hypothetical protein